MIKISPKLTISVFTIVTIILKRPCKFIHVHSFCQPLRFSLTGHSSLTRTQKRLMAGHHKALRSKKNIICYRVLRLFRMIQLLFDCSHLNKITRPHISKVLEQVPFQECHSTPIMIGFQWPDHTATMSGTEQTYSSLSG